MGAGASVSVNTSTIKEIRKMNTRTIKTACGKVALLAMAGTSAFLPLSGTELVTNGSFEEYTGTISQQSGKYENLSATFTLNDWNPVGSVGLSSTLDTTVWKNVANVKGNVACYFQKNSSLSQTINVTEAGTYRVSFRYASRLSPQYYGKGRFYIEIDGAEVGHADCGTDTTFRTAVMETELSAGEHTLVVRHSNELSTDADKRANSVIDGVSITLKDDLLFNGGFEGYMGVMPASGSTAHFFGADATHNADGWVGTSYGLSEASSPYLKGGNGRPFEGSAALHFNGLKEISQTVAIPETGTYEISFVYAPRNLANYAGGRVNVWIDDVKVGYVDCDTTTMEFRRYMVRTQITSGSHVFKLSHTLDNPVSASNTPCSAVDDVSLKAVDNLIMNGSFEKGTVYANSGTYSSAENDAGHSNPGWTVTGKSGLAKIGYPSGAMWASSELEGAGKYSMYLQTANYTYGGTDRQLPAVSVSQSFDVDKTGVYELRFSYAARPYNNYVGGQIFARVYSGDGVGGEMIWERFVIANSKTAFSEFVGTVKFYSTGRYTLEFYAPQLEYSTTAANEKDSVLDNVSLTYKSDIKGLIISFH